MLSLRHIYKSFDDKIILDDASFSLNPSEVVALIGENGTGKTTLLRLIIGKIVPDKGQVILNNEIIGYLPQEPKLGQTIENSFDKEVEPWQIERIMKTVGLDTKDKNTEVSTLSGGQKTRVALAKVLVQNPEPTVLLLDEPTNNLDLEGFVWLENFVKSFSGGILFASHDRKFINKVAIKVMELNKGKLRQYGGDYDFYRRQKLAERESELLHYEESI